MKPINLIKFAPVAAAFLMTTAVAAQQPQQPAERQPMTPDNTSVTVIATGCLKMEKDLPGAKPNMAERAGVGDDFVLTDVKLSKGDMPTGTTAAATPGRPKMFKIEGLDDSQLKPHVNHKVEIQGKWGEPNKASTAAGTAGATDNADDLREIEAVAVKMISATCGTGPTN